MTTDVGVQESEWLSESFTILDEITEVTVESLAKIAARPKHPFAPGQAFQLKEWYHLLMLQPWIHEQTIQDLQAEELAVLQVT